MEEIKKEQKEYQEERFEFSLLVNDNLICKRNFKIYNFIEGSMNTIDFKYTIDEIVDLIDGDLKSKSRVYSWYYFDENYNEPNEFNSDLVDPWECTFKFVVTDNKREVISKIWDGRYYPKAIRERVDLTNKNVKFTTKDGRTYIYNKETYFKENEDRLSLEMYVLRAMIMDKKDLLFEIVKKISTSCSTHDEDYQTLSDYTTSEEYKNRDFELNEDGSVKVNSNGEKLTKKTGPSKKYHYALDAANNKIISEWAASVADKTKEYKASLYV